MSASFRWISLNFTVPRANKSVSLAQRRLRRRARRQCLFQQLEDRRVLNAAPIALADPVYFINVDATLTIGTSDVSPLDNDWDPEGSSLTATLVDSPQHGTLTAFNSDGTFVYDPDTSYTGHDHFTYKANDGAVDSQVVSVSIAVGGDFGVRTNLDDETRSSLMQTGSLELTQSLDIESVADLPIEHPAGADRRA